jgi:hypothetical protein
MQENQQVVLLSDGGDTMRQLQEYLRGGERARRKPADQSPCLESSVVYPDRSPDCGAEKFEALAQLEV